MSFWDQIKSIFNSAEASSSNQPVIHEVIERTEEELEGYKNWKETHSKQRLLDWLKDEYVNFLVNPQSTGDAIDFLNTPSSKGFVLHFYKTRYSNREVIYFFDYLKELILAIDYKSSLSDSRTYNRKDWIEKTDRHYLKPPTNLRNFGKEKFDQRFGNITIELIFRNDKIHLLKFSATTYQDRKYKEAEDFSVLMKKLYTRD
jgi:hypothetical protein